MVKMVAIWGIGTVIAAAMFVIAGIIVAVIMGGVVGCLIAIQVKQNRAANAEKGRK